MASSCVCSSTKETKPVFELILKRAQERLAELEGQKK